MDDRLKRGPAGRFCLQANLHRKLVETSEKPDINESYTRRLQDGGSWEDWEDYQTYEMRYPLSLAITGLQDFSYGYQLQENR
jgi:hypothetical protein